LFIDGAWELITIEPIFPMLGTSLKDFYFSLNKDNSCKDIWINILEKAYAKILGSYYKLQIHNSMITF